MTTELQKAEYAMHAAHADFHAALLALKRLIDIRQEQCSDFYQEEMDEITDLAGLLRRTFERMHRTENHHQHLWSEQHDAAEADAKAADFRKRQQAAHSAVAAAVASGALIRPLKCERCPVEAANLVAHHYDYDKQLDVEWLCRKCHGKHHAENGPAL
jgi:hypothetical protein